jgi:hypothetical protein
MTGRKYALIIDAGFGDLAASDASAKRIEACLDALGFTERTLLSGPHATVAAIRATLTRLEELVRGDALVVYFVGHGEVVRDPTAAKPTDDQPPGPSDVFVLVTHDILDPAATTAGIPGLELIHWLDPIAAATDNVTVILDCCHATGIIPDRPEGHSNRVQYAIDRATHLLRRHYAVYRGPTRSAASGRIVHLVATTENEFAEEGRSLDGTRQIGLFSDALAHALMHPSAADWTWDDHIVTVQRRVLARCRTQRPGVEGPRHRFPFTTRVREPDGSYPCQRDETGAFVLHAGLTHGVDVGDIYDIVHANDPDHRVTEARVTTVGIARAAFDINLTRPGLRAIPVRRMRPIGIALHTTDDDLAALVRVAIPARLGITFVAAGQPADATLELDEHIATLRDAELVLRETAPGSPDGLRRLVVLLTRLAHHHRVERGLRELASAAAHDGPRLSVTWGCGPRQLTGRDELLTRRDAVWVHVEPISHGNLFVTAFHIRGDRSIVALMPDLDHGRTITRGRPTDLTQTAAGQPEPWSLRRSPQIDDHHPVRESFVLIASPVPLSLHGLATPRVVRGGHAAALRGDPPPALVRLDFLLAPDPVDPAN